MQRSFYVRDLVKNTTRTVGPAQCSAPAWLVYAAGTLAYHCVPQGHGADSAPLPPGIYLYRKGGSQPVKLFDEVPMFRSLSITDDGKYVAFHGTVPSRHGQPIHDGTARYASRVPVIYDVAAARATIVDLAPEEGVYNDVPGDLALSGDGSAIAITHPTVYGTKEPRRLLDAGTTVLPLVNGLVDTSDASRQDKVFFVPGWRPGMVSLSTDGSLLLGDTTGQIDLMDISSGIMNTLGGCPQGNNGQQQASVHAGRAVWSCNFRDHQTVRIANIKEGR